MFIPPCLTRTVYYSIDLDMHRRWLRACRSFTNVMLASSLRTTGTSAPGRARFSTYLEHLLSVPVAQRFGHRPLSRIRIIAAILIVYLRKHFHRWLPF